MSKKNIKILQASYPHTGSTLLLNLIHGVLQPDEKHHAEIGDIEKHFIVKTHTMTFDHWMSTYPDYEIYFIVSEREGKQKLNNKVRNYKNVLIVNYDDINITKNNTLEQVSNFILDKLKKFLPSEVFPNISDEIMINNTIKRITNMNEICEKIKNKKFSYCDKFYGIHGHHRGRSPSGKIRYN